MALIKCRECGRDVSTEAVACPGCGAKPKPMPKPSYWNDRLTWPQIILGSLFSVGLLAYCNHVETRSLVKYVDAATLNAEVIGATIEPEAKISDPETMTEGQLAFMVGRVRNSGYKCDSISAAGISGVTNIGVRLHCDHWKHSYDLHDKGGRWVVTVED